MTGPCGILLAAGRATRFGEPKLTQPLPDGTPIALAAANAITAHLSRTIAVVRPDDRELAALLRSAGMDILPCPFADRGMGASLAAAISHTRSAPGWIVALGDMPYIRPGTVRTIRDRLVEGQSLVLPVHQGRRGHPVGFGPEFGPDLEVLDGDIGARSILARHARPEHRLCVSDPGICRDIDTPADLCQAD